MGDDGKLGEEREAAVEELAGRGEAEGEEVEVWVADEEGSPAPPEPGAPEAAAPTAADEVERLQQELAQVRDQWLRTLADLDNFRKRSEREQRELRRFALAEPMRDLLAVVDNLERALDSGGDVEDLKRGVEMILRQLREVLRGQGVREIAASGAPFDPSQHDAVSRFEDPTVSAPTVAEELQRGYTLNDRLLRPALVRVAMPAARGGAGAAPPAGEATPEADRPAAD